MISTARILAAGMSVLGVIVLLAFADRGMACGLVPAGIAVIGSLWWGVPQFNLWWTTRDIRRQMQREVAELIHYSRSAGSGNDSAPRL